MVTEAGSAIGEESAQDAGRLQRRHAKSGSQGRRLVDYALRLAKLRPAEVRFVILYGSAAEGKDRRYSDWDVVVVRKKFLKPAGAVEDLYGMFNGRSVSGWVADSVSFKQRCIGVDDKLFVWRRRELKKTRLLYGDAREFGRIVGKALSRRWTRRRQFAVVRESYVTMVEYLGKMLNKVQSGEGGTYEFYQDGYVIASNFAMVVAALNKIDLDSDKTMFREVLDQAKTRPKNFERDFAAVSGLTGERRSEGAVMSASMRLQRWAQKQVVETFRQSKVGDRGFWQIVKEMKF